MALVGPPRRADARGGGLHSRAGSPLWKRPRCLNVPSTALSSRCSGLFGAKPGSAGILAGLSTVKQSVPARMPALPGGFLFKRASVGRAALQRQPDLLQVMLIVRGHLVEFILQRPHARHAMHELEVAFALVVLASVVDDRFADRFVDPPRDVERHLRVVEPLLP